MSKSSKAIRIVFVSLTKKEGSDNFEVVGTRLLEINLRYPGWYVGGQEEFAKRLAEATLKGLGIYGT